MGQCCEVPKIKSQIEIVRDNILKLKYDAEQNDNILEEMTDKLDQLEIKLSILNGDKTVDDYIKNRLQTQKTLKVSSLKEFDVEARDFLFKKDQKITDYYQIQMPPIGQGAYGEVSKAMYVPTQTLRAVKTIQKKILADDAEYKLKMELEIMKKLDHPNILTVVDCYEDDLCFYIVSDLCTGGELFDYIVQHGRLSERYAAKIMQQILSAVSYCHANSIVHRDLKPENILFESQADDSILKICDFGTAGILDQKDKLYSKIGTPLYIAPEVLKRVYDERCDVWSCGIILFIMLTGQPPFDAETDEELLNKISIGKIDYSQKIWEDLSPDAMDIVKKMLVYDYKSRISAQEALVHNWIKMNEQKAEVDEVKLTNCLNNLQTFHADSKLQEATWTFIVNFLVSNKEKQQLLDNFKALDINGDGTLSRDELIKGFSKTMPPYKAQEEVDKILQQLDKNKNGMINYSEWIMATMNRKNALSMEKLESAFKMFDKDGNGTISLNEIKQVFQGVGEVDDGVWLDLLKEAQITHNQEITFAQFRKMMDKMIERENSK